MDKKRLKEKRGAGVDVKVGMVDIVCLEDFSGAGRNMTKGGTYSVPEGKAKFWIASGVAEEPKAKATKTAPKDKVIRGSKDK